MESFCGDTEESAEDTEGRKKSKLKSLKSRLFGRSKKTVAERIAKLSQSASDITAGKELGSDEDLVCPQGMMGSRALSHDSIFLADQELTDAEPAKVLSQENVHSKIKTLQMKLQQQKLHLGPPPLVLPVRHPDELGRGSETEGPPHNAPDILEADTMCQSVLNTTRSPASSSPISPVPKPVRTKSVPLPYAFVNPSSSSSVEPPVDFSSPPQFTPCLDSSAARHRMSVKPRNQRASTKKRLASTDSRTYSHTLNNISHPEPVKEDEKQIGAQDEVMLKPEQRQTDTPILPQLPCPEVAPITPETAPKSPSTTRQEHPPSGTMPSLSSPVLRVRPHRSVDVRERPHSAFMESELKDKRAAEFDIQLMPHNKKSDLTRTGKSEEPSDQPSSTFGSVVALRSAFHQQVQSEMEVSRGLKRPGQGSGSFHFSIPKAKDGDRPRSGSFVEPREQAEARKKAKVGTDDKLFPVMKVKEEPSDLQPRDGGFALGRLKQEGSPPKSSELQWERRDSSQKIESLKISKNMATDTSPEDEDIDKEVVEEAVEAKQVQEEEEKTCTFGVKLRPTSQSTRFRPDASSNRHSNPPVCEEQDDKRKQEMKNSTTKKLPTDPGDVRPAGAAPAGSSFQGKASTSSAGEPRILPTDVRQVGPSLAAPQEPQPAPQPASSEVSWMSLAMEKTRSLQQLFTSKFPRDFTAVQNTLGSQAPAETPSGAQMQAQPVTKQQSTTAVQTDTAKAEPQPVKPALVQQKAPTTTGPHVAKQVPDPQTVSHPPVQTSPWTSQSPSRSSTLTETSAAQPLAQSPLPSGHDTLQQPPWSHRGLHRTNQLKSTTSPATAPSPLPSLGKGEREVSVQEKEGPSLPGRRAVLGGSVSERAAFLEKQAESASPSGTKGVELRKTQTEVQAPSDTPASTKSTAPSKDTKPEGREWGKPAESSPIKVPDRTRDDKWPRKNVTSSSPSSSPTQPSALQTMSENNQPSWMELAKRKSMAWNDRTMD